jgi:hypothetical protein
MAAGRSEPRLWVRLLWFAGLWLAGVAAVALLGLLIRSVLM